MNNAKMDAVFFIKVPHEAKCPGTLCLMGHFVFRLITGYFGVNYLFFAGCFACGLTIESLSIH